MSRRTELPSKLKFPFSRRTCRTEKEKKKQLSLGKKKKKKRITYYGYPYLPIRYAIKTPRSGGAKANTPRSQVIMWRPKFGVDQYKSVTIFTKPHAGTSPRRIFARHSHNRQASMYGEPKGGPCLFKGVLVGPAKKKFQLFRAPIESDAILHGPHPSSVEQRGELTSAAPKPWLYQCKSTPTLIDYAVSPEKINSKSGHDLACPASWSTCQGPSTSAQKSTSERRTPGSFRTVSTCPMGLPLLYKPSLFDLWERGKGLPRYRNCARQPPQL